MLPIAKMSKSSQQLPFCLIFTPLCFIIPSTHSLALPGLHVLDCSVSLGTKFVPSYEEEDFEISNRKASLHMDIHLRGSWEYADTSLLSREQPEISSSQFKRETNIPLSRHQENSRYRIRFQSINDPKPQD